MGFLGVICGLVLDAAPEDRSHERGDNVRWNAGGCCRVATGPLRGRIRRTPLSGKCIKCATAPILEGGRDQSSDIFTIYAVFPATSL
jgi:hypothetical protein